MRKDLWYIKSFNFTAWNAADLDVNEGKKQIDEMIERCAVNTVTIAFGALQDHSYSTYIDWKGSHVIKDEDLSELVDYAKEEGLKVIIKPMVNTRDGYWRAYIRFFDEDVPCEPKWSDWFKNYTEYIAYYADFCEKNQVDMLIVGCELVGTDHRAQEWRKLVAEVREIYSGLVTYNCDKYQEHNVKWWDVLDVVSSSGYYPYEDWDNQIERIEKVVNEYNKPLFFSECGCPSTDGASKIPNDWTVIGHNPVNLDEQANFFARMFEKCENLKWHYGYCIWDWAVNPNNSLDKSADGGYRVSNKPAQQVIKNYFAK